MPRVSEEYFEKKRKEIVDAAYRVCVRKPITSVVMNDIIAEAGFSHGVIYKYYKDLDEVLRDLVISINSQNRIDERLDEILSKADKKNWEDIIRNIGRMLADYLVEVGTDVLKISLYSDMLAMSEPERVSRIAGELGSENQSPLLYLVIKMAGYLESVIKKEGLKPAKSVEEIIQFIIVNYHGIQTGYVLTSCMDAEQINGKYDPAEMFSVMSESVILLMKGSR
ncbi:MAG: TetR/AcrR family transcriptional regulator [Lachnospiraceae bacterium]|nr:TetR/AcrR family transcriptional regulator [Lachnospiraceae bacterium]